MGSQRRHAFVYFPIRRKMYTSIKPKTLTFAPVRILLQTFSLNRRKKKKRNAKTWLSNNKLSRESAPKYRQEYLAQNITVRDVFYIPQMYNFTLHPHTLSPLTLTSVQRNNFLQWAHPFLHFFKIWKIYANNMKN